jgi:hypothetical protein
MALLACAYALIEEGPLDQLLWNDAYLGVDDFHTATYVPALGTSIALIQTVIALHAVWSICVPIALVETFTRDRGSTPWLGRTGLIVVATIFALGAVFVFWGNYTEFRFIAPWSHQIWIGIAIVGLVMISRWSRQRGWNERHRFALAAGATLTYVWLAFPMAPSDGGSPTMDLVGNVVFGSVAVILLLLAGRAAARSTVASPAGQAHA